MDWRAVAVAVLLLGAGCTSLVGDGPARETVTPAAVPSGSGDALAPGVTDQGVIAPADLVAAHETSLANQSYTLVRNRTRLYNGEQVRRWTTVAAVEPTADRFRISHRLASRTRSETRLIVGTANGTEAFVRTDEGTFRRADRLATTEPPTGGDWLATALEAVHVRTATPGRADADTYRLSGTNYRNASVMVLPRDRFMWVDFEARIDASGRLRDATWRYSLLRGRTNVTVVERIGVTGVGRTRVNTTLPVLGNESGAADSP